MNIDDFRKLPVMGILRGIEPEAIEPLCEAVVSSGLRTVEITMNTPSAPDLIKQMVKASKGRLVIGAGTVLSPDELNSAVDAGATFIVLPTLALEVVEACVKRAIPVFPGGFTPQEICNAWRAGASMVKVFPANLFGPDYIREIKGPFSEIELLACGGVTPENIGSFFACGASAVAFGASVFRKEWLAARQFHLIEKAIRAFISAYAGPAQRSCGQRSSKK
jgi:2-dehydro-3-deoxyphosphogluconate aldolase/(4S)-4-hydroxy-2-oxoglutarate aldolase